MGALHRIKCLEIEYQRITQELEIIDAREGEVTEQTLNRINDLLQDAWMKAMSARSRLKDLDTDFHKCDEIMKKTILQVTLLILLASFCLSG